MPRETPLAASRAHYHMPQPPVRGRLAAAPPQGGPTFPCWQPTFPCWQPSCVALMTRSFGKSSRAESPFAHPRRAKQFQAPPRSPPRARPRSIAPRKGASDLLNADEAHHSASQARAVAPAPSGSRCRPAWRSRCRSRSNPRAAQPQRRPRPRTSRSARAGAAETDPRARSRASVRSRACGCCAGCARAPPGREPP